MFTGIIIGEGKVTKLAKPKSRSAIQMTVDLGKYAKENANPFIDGKKLYEFSKVR